MTSAAEKCVGLTRLLGYEGKMSKTRESIRLFQSDYLEKLTHVHPVTPLVLWGPFIAWLIWRAFAVHDLSPIAVGVLGVSGFFVWTFSEYTLHRWIFHFKGRGRFQERLQFIIHGLH